MLNEPKGYPGYLKNKVALAQHRESRWIDHDSFEGERSLANYSLF